MGEWRTAWGAAGGQAPLRELVEARRGVDRVTVRRVGRAVQRGQAAGSIREARLAVAIARDIQRQDRLSGPKTMRFFALIVVLWTGMAVSSFAAGAIGFGVFFAAFSAWGVWALVTRPRRRRGADRAERVNLEVLERWGEPYRSPTARGTGLAERPAGPRLIAAAAGALVYYVAAFGTLTILIDGGRVTVGGVLASGLMFGVVMTIVNLTWIRGRNERAARRR